MSLTTHPPGPRRGQHIGPYEVLGLLGTGGFGSVFKVRHTQLGSLRALKVLHQGRVPSSQKFLSEARLQAEVKSKHVVQVVDFFEQDGRCALVMEYVDGPRLSDWMMARPPTLDESIEVFSKILEGVGAIHRSGVVHGDLKPANILMVKEDGVWHPKVTDFGISSSRSVSDGADTAQGGTPLYMAPEQAAGLGEIDHRADLFALGCVLYELLFGEPAFVVAEAQEGRLKRQRRATSKPSPSTLHASLAELTDQLLDDVPV